MNASMSDEQITDWLNAVLDAQVELSREPGWESPEEADECWGFFREWRDSFVEEAWNRFVGQS